MNGNQFGQVHVSLAKANTVDKSHSSIESAEQGIIMKLEPLCGTYQGPVGHRIP